MTRATQYLNTNKIDFSILKYKHNSKISSYAKEAVMLLDLHANIVFKTISIIKEKSFFNNVNQKSKVIFKYLNILKNDCLKNSLIIETGGRDDSVIRFLPALNIDDILIIKALSIFKNSLENCKNVK